MKRVKHFLLASCLFPTLLGAQEMASAYFLELTPDAQSAGMAGTGLATTDNGSTAIFHNASTIAFSQEVMGRIFCTSFTLRNPNGLFFLRNGVMHITGHTC